MRKLDFLNERLDMPKDDYAKARAKDIGRRERARLDYEQRIKQTASLQAHIERKANFPDHVLRKQPDGTYLSDPMVFDVSRWGGRHQKGGQNERN